MRDLVLALSLLAAASTASAQALPTTRIDVSGDGLVAHLFRPSAPGRYPGVLLVGGSDGGIGGQEMAELLAGRGIAAMALAYFGMPGLPEELDRIPLEYLDRGLDLLLARPDVDAERVGMGGVSKGGELALLVASRRPEIRAVAVFVPSGVVWQSITRTWAPTSSWSHGGTGLPFVPYGEAPRGSPIVDFYLNGLAQISPESLAAATIAVERINGPILLLSGKADNLWPSTRLSEMVVARLRAKGFRHAVEHVAYEDAGHSISSIRDSVTRLGGTEEGNRAAQLDARRRFLALFQEHLSGERR